MKEISILLTLILLLIFSNSNGQENKTTIITLKNGFSISGKITEQTDKTIKIETSDGKVYEYKMEDVNTINEEILKIKKQRADKFTKKVYYTNITELNYSIGNSKYDKIWYAKSDELTSYLSVQTINGFHFCTKYFLGVGLGLNVHFKEDAIVNDHDSYPLFVDFRLYFLNKRIKPFVIASSGLLFTRISFTGFAKNFYPFINPALGAKIPLSDKISLNTSAGYSFFYTKKTLLTEGSSENHYNYESYSQHFVNNYINCFNIKIGLEF